MFESDCSGGARPSETSSDVYFWAGAPRAHCGKVMSEASVSERRACTSGTTQIGACRLCKKMVEDSAPHPPGIPVCALLPRNEQRAEVG
eukprot:1612750-Pleurochrysis_carterae.AAC.2